MGGGWVVSGFLSSDVQVSLVTPQKNERDLRKCPLGQVKATWHSVLPKLVAALWAPVSPTPQAPVPGTRPHWSSQRGACLGCFWSPGPAPCHSGSGWSSGRALLGVQPRVGFWFHRPPGPAELSSPVCSELLSPAAFLYLNSSLRSSANDGTKANYRVSVVFRKYSMQSHFVLCILLSFFFFLFFICHLALCITLILKMFSFLWRMLFFLLISFWNGAVSFLSQLFKQASCYEI